MVKLKGFDMKPVVFLDRDGTIIAEKNYLNDPAMVELLPGAAEGLKFLQQNGFELIVLTNQSGIGRGYYTLTETHNVNRRLCELLIKNNVKISLRRIYFCPHAPDEKCTCRKPQTGMALKAQSHWLFDIKKGYVIGDKLSDLELGHNLNLPTVLVKTGYGATLDESSLQLATYVADNLDDAARWIVANSMPHC